MISPDLVRVKEIIGVSLNGNSEGQVPSDLFNLLTRLWQAAGGGDRIPLRGDLRVIAGDIDDACVTCVCGVFRCLLTGKDDSGVKVYRPEPVGWKLGMVGDELSYANTTQALRVESNLVVNCRWRQ